MSDRSPHSPHEGPADSGHRVALQGVLKELSVCLDRSGDRQNSAEALIDWLEKRQ